MKLYRKAWAKQLFSKGMLQTIDDSIEAQRSNNREGTGASGFHAVFECLKERSEFTNVIDMEVTDEEMGHLLPRQIVAGKGMHGAGSAIQHDLRISGLDEVSGRIAVAIRDRGA